jgi:hypothetical protein
MTSREWIGGVVLCCYPRQVRAERGAEMLGTMLDASAGSSGAFARESLLLGIGGLRERASSSARLPVGGLIADGFRWAAIVVASIVTANLVNERWVQHVQVASGSRLLLLGAMFACWLAGYQRASGIVGLVWLARWVLLGGVGGFHIGPVVVYLVPLVGFSAMVVAPVGPAREQRRTA